MNRGPLTDSFLLPALDKREEGGGVNWRCVTKLMNYIHNANAITEDLRYSLKSRLKCRDSQCVLNTLTVYYTISLNGSEAVREQMAEKKAMRRWEKLFLKSKEKIVRHAVLQLLMDWSYLFGNEAIGKRSAYMMRELSNRHGLTFRPTRLAAELYEVMHCDPRPAGFFKGFEFEYNENQIIAQQEKCEGSFVGCVMWRGGGVDVKKSLVSCASNLTTGSFKLGSVKNFFTRGSGKSLKKHSESAIVRELAANDGSKPSWAREGE